MIYLFRALFREDSVAWSLGLTPDGEMQRTVLEAFPSTVLMRLFNPLHSIRANPMPVLCLATKLSCCESFRCCSSTEGSLGSAGLGSPDPAQALCLQCWGDAVLPCTVLLSYFPAFVCGSRGRVVPGPPCRGLSPSYSSGRRLWSDTFWHALLLTGTARHKLTAPCKPLV